jgi:hypothetical protein
MTRGLKIIAATVILGVVLLALACRPETERFDPRADEYAEGQCP